MTEPSPRHSPERQDDPADTLLAELLADDTGDLQQRFEAACDRHPALASTLRRRLAALQQVGAVASGAPPLRLGRFVLGRRLGGGGMGVVYLAREDPLGREVALKLLRPEMAWLEGSRARFRREAAAIAELHHPAIVPMHAFGEEDGVAYCAMARIRGRSLAELLAGLRGRDPASLTGADLGRPQERSHVEACIAITAVIAGALQHAHEHGIVHRDVKPSNVMIADDGRVMLIDFGLAQCAGDAAMTRTGTQPGSLAYMSPEQVRGEPIDARTDVFSLGATLYELLALEPPFLAETEEATRRRVLAAAPTPLRQRNRRVPADLIAVVETALAPERERRYGSMALFGQDLQALLERRPVRARSPGPLLRAKRFAQRRPAWATGLLLGSAIAFGGPTLLLLQESAARHRIENEAMRARQAEQVSQREAATARGVVEFLQDLFDEVSPSRALGNTVTARTVLDRGVDRIRGELVRDPELRAALLEAMGSVYDNLGLYEQAGPLLQECLSLRQRAVGSDPSALGRVELLLAGYAEGIGDQAAIEQHLQRALTALPPPSESALAASTEVDLGSALANRGATAEAKARLQEGVAQLRRHADAAQLGWALRTLALFVAQTAGPEQAAPLFDESVQRLSATLPAGHPRRMLAQANRARNWLDLGRVDEALAELQHVEAEADRVFGASHPLLAQVRMDLAEAWLRAGQPRAARPLADAAWAVCRDSLPADHALLARACSLLADVAAETGDLATARRADDEAVAIYRRRHPDGHFDLAAALSASTRLHTQMGDLRGAIDRGREAVAIHERIDQPGSSLSALPKAHLADALALSGCLDEALALARSAAAADPPGSAGQLVRLYLTQVLLLAGRTDEAALALGSMETTSATLGPRLRAWVAFLRGWLEDLTGHADRAVGPLREALALQEASVGQDSPLLCTTLSELAVALVRTRDVDGGLQALQRAVAIGERTLPADSPCRLLPLLNLGAVQQMRGDASAALQVALECLRILRVTGAAEDPKANAAAQLLITAAIAEPVRGALARLAAAPTIDALLAPNDPLRPYFGLAAATGTRR